jgi:hypothetical protein
LQAERLKIRVKMVVDFIAFGLILEELKLLISHRVNHIDMVASHTPNELRASQKKCHCEKNRFQP